MITFHGKCLFLHEICTEVQPFKLQLLLFSKQVTENKFAHYSTQRRTYWSSNAAQKCSDILNKLCEEFCRLIKDFKESRNPNPTVNSSFLLQSKIVPENLHLELMDTQNDNGIRAKSVL
jgi:hypothetical protein